MSEDPPVVAEASDVRHLDSFVDRLCRRFEDPEAEWSDRELGPLALEAFALQFAANVPYRAYCEARARTPDSVQRWEDIPAVPSRAFRHLDLVCGRAEEAEVVFRTSGTTGGAGRRGRHFVRSLALYRASSLPPFERYVLAGAGPFRFLSLIPSPAELPDSSLSRMVGMAAQAFATDVCWAVDGNGTIDRDALADAATTTEPVLLLGTPHAFLHALSADGPRAIPRLPPGSRIMETGGFKGRIGEIPRAELYALLVEATGVPADRIVSEYGMTELLSQLYTPVLREGAAGAEGYVPAPWLRVRALDPVSLEPVERGQEGILAFFDLANVASICHVLTEDLGRVAEGRVWLSGRSPGAEPRGCSRAMDELMASARQP